MAAPDLSSVLLFIAGELEAGRGVHYSGAIRQAARRLQELQREATEAGRSESGCEFCGGPLVQPVAGRRRRFCSDSHRRKWAVMR